MGLQIDAEGRPVGKVVKHVKGRVGWVLYEDPVGRGRGGHPAYLVMTMEGQRAWWRMDRCQVVEGEPGGPSNGVRV